MGDSAKSWDLKSPTDVAEALDWVRRRMKGNGMVLVAIGMNTVAYSLDKNMSAGDGAALVEAQVNMGTLERGFQELKLRAMTRGWSRRQDMEGPPE
jgi:hypothetical protein